MGSSPYVHNIEIVVYYDLYGTQGESAEKKTIEVINSPLNFTGKKKGKQPPESNNVQ